jgi:CIC family chloride channel protein
LEEDALFQFALQQKFDYHNIPFYLVLGIFGGLISRYYAYAFKATEHRVHSLKMGVFTRAAVAGMMLMALFWVFPPLFGEGYGSVKLLANGNPHLLIGQSSLFKMLPDTFGLLMFTLLIVLMKPVAAGITIGGGGNGGNFAPSLFSGAFLGYFTAKLINLLPWVKVPEGNFSLVGMAAVLSGVMYSPLTAIFLIAEITQGYELFIPLMLVSSISFFMVKAKNRFSMETRKLAEEGQILTHIKEHNILTGLRLEEMLNEKYETILPHQTLADLVKLIKRSEKNIFAVTDTEERLVGIVELNDIKKQLFEPGGHEKILIGQLMKKPPGLLNINQPMQAVMQEFDLAQSWYLPVLDEDKRFIGFISKTKMFARYREVLAMENDLN